MASSASWIPGYGRNPLIAQSCASTGAPSSLAATSAIVDFPVAWSPVTRTSSTSVLARLVDLAPPRMIR